MRRAVIRVCFCIVLAFLTAFLFSSMAGAAEAPDTETKLKENKKLQQAEKIENKGEIDEKPSVETDHEEQRQADANEETEEDESTEGIRILSSLPVEKVTLGGFIDDGKLQSAKQQGLITAFAVQP